MGVPHSPLERLTGPWMRPAGSQAAQRPRLQGTHRADVAIVGAGLTGALLAWNLRRSGLRIVVLEAGTAPSDATAAGFGMLVTGLGEHCVNSRRTYGPEAARALWRMHNDSLNVVERAVRQGGIECGLRRDGGLAAAADAATVPELQESVRLSRADGFEARWVEADEADELAGARGLHGALLHPRDGSIDPVAFVAGLLEECERAGVTVVERSPVLRLAGGVRASEGRNEVRTADGGVECQSVVVCGDRAAAALLPEVAGHLSLVQADAFAFPLRDTHGPGGRADETRLPTYCGHGETYWRFDGGRLLLGAGDHPARPASASSLPGLGVGTAASDASDERATHDARRAAEAFVTRHVPAASPRAVAHWSGPIGWSPDGLPIVGRLRPGVWCGLAYAGLGFGYAPTAAARIAEDLLQGREQVSPLFSPGRFSKPLPAAAEPSDAEAQAGPPDRAKASA